jgi:hypothetical protein
VRGLHLLPRRSNHHEPLHLIKRMRVRLVSGAAKPEFTAATPGAEGERGNETAMSDQPHSPLAGLSLDTAIHLCWVLRDIKAKRTKLSPVSPDDLSTLIEMGLIEMRDEAPALTNEGERALDWG